MTRLQDFAQDELFGREAEQAKLISFLNESEKYKYFLLGGASGVGKTQLVAKSIDKYLQFTKSNIILAKSKFYQFEQDFTFAVINDLFVQIFSQLQNDEITCYNQIKKIISPLTLMAALPIMPSFVPIFGEGQFRVKQADRPLPLATITNISKIILREVSRFKRIVIFIDDIQWIDPSSLHLISSMLSLQHHDSVQFIITYRDEEIGTNLNLVQELESLKTNVSAISLGLNNITNESVNAWISKMLQVTKNDQVDKLANLIFEQSFGNSLFTKTLIEEFLSNYKSQDI
jgi:predicted ATPase